MFSVLFNFLYSFTRSFGHTTMLKVNKCELLMYIQLPHIWIYFQGKKKMQIANVHTASYMHLISFGTIAAE
jgi:hypothetical protein